MTTAPTPRKRRAALERLITQDKVDFILPPWGTGLNLAVGPILNKAGYPHLAVTAVTDRAPELAKRWPNSFWLLGTSVGRRHPGGAAGQAARRRQDRRQRRHGQRRRRVRHRPVGRGASGARRRPTSSSPMTRPIRSAPRTLSPIVNEVKALNPDVFIAFSYPPDTFGLTEQARIAGFNPKVFYTGVGTAFPLFKQKFGANAEGVMGIGGWNGDSAADQGLPGTPQGGIGQRRGAGSLGQPVTYASLQMLQQAIERVGKIDREAVIKDLQTGTFDTVIGKVKFENNLPTKYWWVGQWQDGEFYGVAPAANEGARAPVFRSRPGRRRDRRSIATGDERMTNAIFTGLMLGGMYALIAMGLTLQYGVARIMNLSYGEFLVAAAFAAFWLFTGWAVNPLLGLVDRGSLRVRRQHCCSIASCSCRWCGAPARATHSRSTASWQPSACCSSFRASCWRCSAAPISATPSLRYRSACSAKFWPLNRLIALRPCGRWSGSALYLVLTRTRYGTAIRAVAVDPVAAQLVAIDVQQDLGICVRARRRAGGGGRRPDQHVPDLQRHIGRGVHHEGADRGHHGRRRQSARRLVAGLLLGLSRSAGRDLRRSRADACGQLTRCSSPCCWCEPAGLVRKSAAMSAGAHSRTASRPACGLAALPLRAALRGRLSACARASASCNYTVLATAWSLFSGPTRYVSLATVAFFGIGAYTVAVLGEVLAWPLVLVIAAAIGIAGGASSSASRRCGSQRHPLRHLHVRPGGADRASS